VHIVEKMQNNLNEENPYFENEEDEE